MIRIKESPDQEFHSKKEAHKWLLKHSDSIIRFKKAQILKSFEKGSAPTLPFMTKSHMDASKAETPSWVKEGFFYPIINTTKYMDDHGDVHMNGIWDRSIKHGGDVHYVDSHSLKLSDVIAWPENVTPFTKEIPWSLVGKNYEGNTQALVFEIPKDKVNHELARKVINEGRKIQNSVRMQYVSIKMAINDEDPDFADNKAIWDSVYPSIANKDVADEAGYFFAVSEAKIVAEGSMVLRGSNDATTNIYGGTADSTPSLEDSEKSTPQFEVSEAIQKIKFNFKS